MNPFKSIISGLTRPRYEIAGVWKPNWYMVLGSEVTNLADGTPVVVVLGARVRHEARTYRLEVLGKDQEALSILADQIPVPEGMPSFAIRFRYERITFVWFWQKNNDKLPNNSVHIEPDLYVE